MSVLVYTDINKWKTHNFYNRMSNIAHKENDRLKQSSCDNHHSANSAKEHQ